MHRPLFLAPVVALIGVFVWTAIASAQEDPSSVLLRFQDARAQQLVAAPSVPAAEPAERGNPQQLELPVDP